MAGFEYDRETYKNSYVTDAERDAVHVAAQLATLSSQKIAGTPGSRWFLSTGVRVDNIHTGDLPEDETDAGRPFIPASSITQVDPRISVAYLARESDDGTFGATRIHGSFGTGIRPPDGFELGFTDNPQLKPEQNISFDSGVEQRFFNDKAALDDDLFSTIATRTRSSRWADRLRISVRCSSANLAKSRAYGIESSLRLRPFRSLEIMGEYTWLNTAILALDGSLAVQPPFVVGQPLIRRPRSSGATT